MTFNTEIELLNVLKAVFRHGGGIIDGNPDGEKMTIDQAVAAIKHILPKDPECPYPDGGKLYWISEMQMHRLKLVSANVVKEITDQEYLSEDRLEQIKNELQEEELRADMDYDERTAREE